jgi:hypothetical protein
MADLRRGAAAGNFIDFSSKLNPITVSKLPATADFHGTVHLDLGIGNTALCLSTILHNVCKFQQLGKADGFSFYRY